MGPEQLKSTIFALKAALGRELKPPESSSWWSSSPPAEWLDYVAAKNTYNKFTLLPVLERTGLVNGLTVDIKQLRLHDDIIPALMIAMPINEIIDFRYGQQNNFVTVCLRNVLSAIEQKPAALSEANYTLLYGRVVLALKGKLSFFSDNEKAALAKRWFVNWHEEHFWQGQIDIAQDFIQKLEEMPRDFNVRAIIRLTKKLHAEVSLVAYEYLSDEAELKTTPNKVAAILEQGLKWLELLDQYRPTNEPTNPSYDEVVQLTARAVKIMSSYIKGFMDSTNAGVEYTYSNFRLPRETLQKQFTIMESLWVELGKQKSEESGYLESVTRIIEQKVAARDKLFAEAAQDPKYKYHFRSDIPWVRMVGERFIGRLRGVVEHLNTIVDKGLVIESPRLE